MTRNGLRAALALERADDRWSLVGDEEIAAIPDRVVDELVAALESYRGPADMPPDPRHLRPLVDAAGYLHGETTRSGAWRVLGVLPKEGRRYVGSAYKRVSWAVYRAAFDYGLGTASHASRDLYERRVSRVEEPA